MIGGGSARVHQAARLALANEVASGPSMCDRVSDPESATHALAETGAPEDAPLLAAHMEVGTARSRAAAVAGLHRLGRLPPGTAASLLRDPAPAVVRVAARARARRPPGQDELLALLDPGQPRHTQEAALRLLRRGRTAGRMLGDLTLLADAQPGYDPELVAGARQDLAGWLRRRAATAYDVLIPTEAARARHLLATVGHAAGRPSRPHLNPATEQLLRFHLRL